MQGSEYHGLTKDKPPSTETHWRQAGRDYGWPYPVPIPAEFWVPHGEDAPADWFNRFMDTSRQEEAHRILHSRS